MAMLDDVIMNHEYTEISLFRGSLNYFKAVKLLLEGEEECPMDVYGFLVSHSVELALKAFLVKQGSSEANIVKLGHDLERCWIKCQNSGLQIEAEVPQWCRLINSAHNKPFLFRYARTNTGLVTPSKQEMCTKLDDLLETISLSVNIGRDGNHMQ